MDQSSCLNLLNSSFDLIEQLTTKKGLHVHTDLLWLELFNIMPMHWYDTLELASRLILLMLRATQSHIRALRAALSAII